jgi:ribosomal protein S18 acetylase RimI-like enzyme
LSPERRPARADDEPFLRELYLSTRGELAAWPELVDLQFEAQRRDWEDRFPDSEQEIVVLGDDPVGRSWVAWAVDGCVIVDLALLPEHRSAGLGTALALETVARADRAGLPIRISVLRSNEGAMRFWTRLGFRQTEGDEMYLSFVRAPASAVADVRD